MNQPTPPREAVLIRIAREAARIKIPAAAKTAGISTARWSQIENGYETRQGKRKHVSAPSGTLAHMAHAVGVAPHRLEEAGRTDAAGVLREILRLQAEQMQADGDGLPDGLTLEGFTPDEIRTAIEFIKALRRSAPSEPERRAGNGA